MPIISMYSYIEHVQSSLQGVDNYKWWLVVVRWQKAWCNIDLVAALHSFVVRRMRSTPLRSWTTGGSTGAPFTPNSPPSLTSGRPAVASTKWGQIALRSSFCICTHECRIKFLILNERLQKTKNWRACGHDCKSPALAWTRNVATKCECVY